MAAITKKQFTELNINSFISVVNSRIDGSGCTLVLKDFDNTVAVLKFKKSTPLFAFTPKPSQLLERLLEDELSKHVMGCSITFGGDALFEISPH
jgi:hypothetical protein